MTSNRPADLYVVTAIALVCGALALLIPPALSPVRIVALPLVLLLPGYALTSALLSTERLGIPERLVFSMSLSVVAVIIGGLLLSLLPQGMNTVSWTVYLVGTVAALSVVALVRPRGQGGATAPVQTWYLRAGFRPRQVVQLVIAAGIVCAAFAVAILGAQRQKYAPFTQLWMQPVGRASLQGTGLHMAVRVGVTNREPKAIAGRIVVTLDGRTVKVWPSVYLRSQHDWVSTLVLHPSGARHIARVEADLYPTSAPTTSYRRVVLWLSENAPPSAG
jgi:uncharacterized membrane protein